MTTTTMLELGQIIDERQDLNPRKSNRDQSLDELAASIKANGLAQSIRVRARGNAYEVTAGHRRFAALQMLLAAGDITAGYPVPVILADEDDARVQEMALVENVERLPMTPVDEFKGFLALSEAGHSAADIALRFGVPERRVLQRLQLAGLHPAILEALDAGKITMETAQAYCISADQERQHEVFKSRVHGWQINSAREIKIDLTDEAITSGSQLANYIGKDAYVAAGGEIVSDLFGDQAFWTSRELIAKLADAVDEGRIAAWKAEGWSFVEDADSFGNPWGARRLQPEPVDMSKKDSKRMKAIAARMDEVSALLEQNDDEALDAEHDALTDEIDAIESKYSGNGFSDAQKAASGVVYSKHGDQVWLGVVRHSKSEDSEDRPQKPQQNGMPASLSQKLSEAMTLAVRERIAKDKHLAMAFMTATLLQRKTAAKAPIVLSKARHPFGMEKHFEDEPFANVLKLCMLQRPADLSETFAGLVAEFADFTDACAGVEWGLAAQRPQIVETIGRVDMHAHFDALGYFKAVSKDDIAAVWTEMGQTEPLNLNNNKAALAKTAADAATACGWLPEPLRTSAYAGPLGVNPAETQEAA
jgi:ParB family transcriptional regulator, chromosome partitioning protein